MNVFVTGGSGFVGRNLIRMLVAGGDNVRALVRSDRAEAVVRAAGAEPVSGDLAEIEVMRAGMRGCGAVVHSAAVMAFFGRCKEMETVNIHGTRCVIEAAKAVGIPRLVFISAAAVVSDGHPVIQADESRPYPPRVFGTYCRTKAEAEKLVLGANSTGFSAVAVRPPCIWGVGDATFLPTVVAAVKRRQFIWIDRGNYSYATCHVRNVCEGAILAIRHGRAGQAYFLTDGDPPVTFRQFLTGLLATQGVKPGSVSLPRWLAWRMAAVLEGMPFSWAPPITRAHLALIGGEVTVGDSKARRELGYRGHVSREKGLEELAAG
ncbi:MAG: NAD-dependent epimerase/dehydratase family protein [Deltaproteobacteria bacterium]|nr:NAD-dependent epimerase/dehydratase family protein [Deltaproteobacteria bacterium]